MFIVIDEESFQSLQDTPIPEECPLDLQHRVGRYVKLVEAWQEARAPISWLDKVFVGGALGYLAEYAGWGLHAEELYARSRIP